MATFTTAYNLAKPDRLTDFMDPSDHINPNSDLIDSALNDLSGQANLVSLIGVRTQTADSSSSTSTLVALPNLTVSFDDGQEFFYFATLIFSGTGSARVSVTVDGANLKLGGMMRNTITSGAGSSSLFLRAETGSNSGSPIEGHINSTTVEAVIWGFVDSFATGSIKFEFAQASTGTATLKAGSFVEVVHVPGT